MNEMKWKIWFKTFNDAGTQTGAGVCIDSYTRKRNSLMALKDSNGSLVRQIHLL